MPRALLDLYAHIVVDVHVKDIGDEVEGILIILHLGVEAGQIEAVGEVVLVDFAKVLVAAGADELRDARHVSAAFGMEMSEWHEQ